MSAENRAWSIGMTERFRETAAQKNLRLLANVAPNSYSNDQVDNTKIKLPKYSMAKKLNIKEKLLEREG